MAGKLGGERAFYQSRRFRSHAHTSTQASKRAGREKTEGDAIQYIPFKNRADRAGRMPQHTPRLQSALLFIDPAHK